MHSLFRVVVLLFVVACTSVQPAYDSITPMPVEPPAVQIAEEIVSPPNANSPVPMEELNVEGSDEVPPAPLENGKSEYVPYSELGCEKLVIADEFSSVCGIEGKVFVTSKVGTRNCFVSAKSVDNERLTAGVSVTALADGVAAMKEFERRLVVLKIGADRSVGERAYTMKKIDRDTLNFVRNNFLVEVSADSRLCAKEKMVELAKLVDGRLK